ncbi:MAG: RNA polymerase sigma factor [Planctomycetota bacterium]
MVHDSTPAERAGPSSTPPSMEGGGDAAPPISIGRLVRDYHQDVFRYAYRLVGQVSDAEDLSQQTFLVAQQKLDQIRDGSKARQWLLAVLRSCFVKSRRRRRPMAAANLEVDLNQVCVKPPGHEEVDSELLQAALDELPDQYRLMLVMFYFDELSYKDMARELGLPLGTVMSRLARAKVRLRESLVRREKPACGTPSQNR